MVRITWSWPSFKTCVISTVLYAKCKWLFVGSLLSSKRLEFKSVVTPDQTIPIVKGGIWVDHDPVLSAEEFDRMHEKMITQYQQAIRGMTSQLAILQKKPSFTMNLVIHMITALQKRQVLQVQLKRGMNG